MYKDIASINKRIAELENDVSREDALQYAYKILANSKSK